MPNDSDQQTTEKQASGKQRAQGPTLGRPPTYNPVTIDIICERIAAGETLSQICRTPGMPNRYTVHRWRMKYPDFDRTYTQARVTQAEGWADEIIEISDDSSRDTVTKTTPQGREYEAVDNENIQRSRLMVDTRKFLMAKIAPKIYGDKLQHEHSGEIVQRVELSDRERMRRLATFLLEDQFSGALIEGQLEPARGDIATPPCTDDEQ